MRDNVVRKINDQKVIVRILPFSDPECLELVDALRKGGMTMFAVSFDHKQKNYDHTIHIIDLLTRAMDRDVSIGACDVLSTDMVFAAKEAGAKFIFSPNVNDAVISATIANGMVSIPGAQTPTEIIYASNCGADFVSIYPAGNMGPAYFRNIQDSLGHISMLAHGGINRNNVRLYLHSGVRGICVDDCLYNSDEVKEHKWSDITIRAKTFMDTI